MKGQLIGYVRVSSIEQNEVRQLEGLNLDHIFSDKASAKDIDRPGLKAMLSYIRRGDELYVHSMDRLARNLDDLRKMVSDLTSQGIKIHFIKEGLSFTGEDSPMSKLLLSMMGAFAEFERSLIRERQREGIELAKKRGAYKGRKKCLSPNQIQYLSDRIKTGVAKAKVAREMGISRETLYTYLRGNDTVLKNLYQIL